MLGIFYTQSCYNETPVVLFWSLFHKPMRHISDGVVWSINSFEQVTNTHLKCGEISRRIIIHVHGKTFYFGLCSTPIQPAYVVWPINSLEQQHPPWGLERSPDRLSLLTNVDYRTIGGIQWGAASLWSIDSPEVAELRRHELDYDRVIILGFFFTKNVLLTFCFYNFW